MKTFASFMFLTLTGITFSFFVLFLQNQTNSISVELFFGIYALILLLNMILTILVLNFILYLEGLRFKRFLKLVEEAFDKALEK
ncbi:MAG: hypothetical protein ACRCXZ_03430 [Patescibacteria group bacterium]